MLKKQGIIEPKLNSKPSFKNILNLNEAKLPSRSKSKSKSTSQVKISTVPNKSPKKTIHSHNDSNNISINSNQNAHNNQQMPYQSEINREEHSKMGKYDDVNSSVSRSRQSRSPKRDSGKEQMRQVVLLKNRTVQLEQRILAACQNAKKQGFAIQKQGKNKVSVNGNKKQEQSVSAYPQLKLLQRKLDDYLTELKDNSEKIQHTYNTQLEQLCKRTDSSDVPQSSILQRFEQRPTISPNMSQLQSKLAKLQNLLT